MKRIIAFAALAGAISMAGPATAQEKLEVWWGKGFYAGEDEALFAAIRKFEAKTGVKVELSLYAPQEIVPKTVAALDAKTVPDVSYGDVYDFQTTSKWAFEGRLEDISSIIQPMLGEFAQGTVETVNLWNDVAKKRAYYAFPLKQQTMHIQYWIDLLNQAGFKESDIPKDWAGYWSFWCDKVQAGFRRATGTRGFAVGHPMGVDSSDSFYSFLTFMDAHGVSLVAEDGKLRVDEPAVKAGLVAAVRDYSSLYTRGCTPPSSTSWKDPDNNVAFHNRTTVLTHNATISIASKWFDDANNATLTADQRAQAKKHYDENIATAGFPMRPNGQPMVYRAAVKTGMIFADSRNKARAKEFVAFMLQAENLTAYVEGALGRWFPVTKEGQQSAFWNADPHRRAVRDQFANGTVTFEFTKNWKFTILNNENVWAKAVNRVVNENVPVERAVDEMIARIKQVAG